MTSPKAWRNRIVGTADVDPRELVDNPLNFRAHPSHQRGAMRGLLDELGWIVEVIVARDTGVIVDGHMRVALAVEAEEPTVPVKYVDLEPDEVALALTALDQSAALAVTDDELLLSLLADAQTEDGAVLAMLGRMRSSSQAEVDRAKAMAEKEAAREAGAALDPGSTFDATLAVYETTSARQIVLILDADTHAELAGGLSAVAQAHGLDSPTAAVRHLLDRYIASLPRPDWDGEFRALMDSLDA